MYLFFLLCAILFFSHSARCDPCRVVGKTIADGPAFPEVLPVVLLRQRDNKNDERRRSDVVVSTPCPTVAPE